MRKLLLAFFLLALASACVVTDVFNTATHPATKVETDKWSFESPAGWSVNKGSLATGQNASKYKNLSLTILYQLKRDGTNSVITVAYRDLPDGSSLERELRQTYASAVPAIRNQREGTSEVGSRPGLVLIYERPWGEPYYRFQDTWVEKDGVIYVFSLQSSLKVSAEDQAAYDGVIKSIQWK